MRLLVLGGTRFVGRAVVEDALARGWEVTALNRGVTGSVPDGVTALLADRTSESALAAALGTATWDLVVDTWSGAPAVAGLAARALTGRARRYGYVFSESVYTRGSHVDESSPLVDADPDAVDGDYSEIKRGAELAIQRVPRRRARAGRLDPRTARGHRPAALVVAPDRPGHPARRLEGSVGQVMAARESYDARQG